MQIYASSYEWMSNLVEFVNSNLPIQFYSISATSEKVQFLAHGFQPDMSQEDKDLFKASLGCMIKYFLKSRKSGCPIPIAAVERMRHHRDELYTSRHRAFNCSQFIFLKSPTVSKTITCPSMQSLPAMGALVPKLYPSCASKVLPLLEHRPQLRLCPRSTQETLCQLSGSSIRLTTSLAPKDQSSNFVNSSFSVFVSCINFLQKLDLRKREFDTCFVKVESIEALVSFERKVSTLLTKLSDLPDILSSAFTQPKSSLLKRNMKNQVDDDDNLTGGFVDKDSEFVSRIIKEQPELICHDKLNEEGI
ncbi:hypothetical protein ACOME3_000789 [Neoechinorhynchus agilis]